MAEFVRIKSQLILRGKVKDFNYKVIPIAEGKFVLIEYVTENLRTLSSEIISEKRLSQILNELREGGDIKMPSEYEIKRFLNYKP